MENQEKFLKFAKDWQKAKDVGEVAKKNGMSCPEASRVAGRLRKMGIELKKFRVGIVLDVEAIKKAIA